MRTYFTFKMEKKQRPIAKSRQTAYSYSRRVMIILDSRHKVKLCNIFKQDQIAMHEYKSTMQNYLNL